MQSVSLASKNFESTSGYCKVQGASFLHKMYESTPGGCKVQGLHMGDFVKALWGGGNLACNLSASSLRFIFISFLCLPKYKILIFWALDTFQNRKEKPLDF